MKDYIVDLLHIGEIYNFQLVEINFYTVHVLIEDEISDEKIILIQKCIDKTCPGMFGFTVKRK